MIARCIVLAFLVTTACRSAQREPQPSSGSGSGTLAMAPGSPEMGAAKPAMAPAAQPMQPDLADTPADQLGTAPAGFGLDVGTKAPDGLLTDITGKKQQLSALYGQGPSFVIFYRGGWCPFCNIQLHRLAQSTPELEKHNLKLVAISVETPDEEAKMQAQHGVPFPMLSDSDLTVHKAFRVVHVPPDAEAKALAQYGIDLEARSGGQHHHSFAVPAVFLIDRMGTIRWRHVNEDYKKRPSPAQMIEVAERTLSN